MFQPGIHQDSDIMIEDEDNEDIYKEETHLENEAQEDMVCGDQEVIEAHEEPVAL